MFTFGEKASLRARVHVYNGTVYLKERGKALKVIVTRTGCPFAAVTIEDAETDAKVIRRNMIESL